MPECKFRKPNESRGMNKEENGISKKKTCFHSLHSLLIINVDCKNLHHYNSIRRLGNNENKGKLAKQALYGWIHNKTRYVIEMCDRDEQLLVAFNQLHDFPLQTSAMQSRMLLSITNVANVFLLAMKAIRKNCFLVENIWT